MRAIPRKNQWFDAVAYDIGPAKGGRQVLTAGVDPASTAKDTLTATVTKTSTTVYRLTDTSKQWTDKQWVNAWVVFPNGFMIKAYKSGANYIELYKPSQIPTDGVYQVGTFMYNVYSREYGKAVVLFRPEDGRQAGQHRRLGRDGDASRDRGRPSGQYFLLNRDGSVETTARTTLTLRNTDGAVLVKDFTTKTPITFADVPSDYWAHDAIIAAAERGSRSGDGNGSYRPGTS